MKIKTVLSLSIVFFSSFSAKAETLDRILATVGNQIILLSDLQKAVQVASQGQASLSSSGKISGKNISKTDVENLLDQLIDQRILSAKTKDHELVLSEEELDKEIENFMKERNLSKEQFRELLKQEAEDYDTYRQEFKRQIETQRFIGKVIKPLVTVTDDELRTYYLQLNKSKMAQKIVLRSLMIDLKSDLSPAEKTEKQKTIKTIKESIDTQKNSFAELVKLYSEAPDAVKNAGLLPARHIQELPEVVRKEIPKSKPGDVLGPFSIGSSLYFFEFVKSEMEQTSDFVRNKEQIRNKLLETKFQERLNEYVEAERSKVKVAKMDFKVT